MLVRSRGRALARGEAHGAPDSDRGQENTAARLPVPVEVQTWHVSPRVSRGPPRQLSLVWCSAQPRRQQSWPTQRGPAALSSAASSPTLRYPLEACSTLRLRTSRVDERGRPCVSSDSARLAPSFPDGGAATCRTPKKVRRAAASATPACFASLRTEVGDEPRRALTPAKRCAR